MTVGNDNDSIISGIPDEVISEMIVSANAARAHSYAPYSDFRVGAALLTSEESGYSIVTGCNIENAAYSPGNCAERTAVFKAVSEGKRSFAAIAIVAGKDDEADTYTSPCGVCRQVLREFVNPKEFYVIMAKNTDDYIVRTLEELFPLSFGPENLN